MTQQERRSNELAQLIAQHRVVRVSMQAEHAVCVARVDMPEFGIVKGEMFHLFASSYQGYAYIVADGCGCKRYEFRRDCKHCQSASKINVARYRARQTNKLSWAEQQRQARAEMTADEQREQLLALGDRRWMAA